VVSGNSTGTTPQTLCGLAKEFHPQHITIYCT
jgi:hypothetical protein